MRIGWLLLTITLSAVCGCIGSGKKSSGAPDPLLGKERERPRDKDTPFWADDETPSRRDTTTSRDRDREPASRSTERDGVLAGQLVGSDGNALPKGQILLAPVSENAVTATAGTKQQGVEADEQGYFVIRGLKPGTTYQLRVRGDENGRVVGGTAVVTPPNTHILIPLSEKNVSTLTPSGLPALGSTGPFAPKPPANAAAATYASDPLTSDDQGFAPGKAAPPPKSYPSPPPAPGYSSAPLPSVTVPPPPPPISLPTPAPRYAPDPPPPGHAVMSAVPAGFAAIPTPLAPTTSKRIDFRLYDLDGRPWDFSSHRGRLVLLDFWSTTCGPCLRAMPEVIALQAKYGSYLEVVGVACERPGPMENRVKDVEAVRRRFERNGNAINYKLLLEGERADERVQDRFRISSVPTLILLDHAGTVVWRGHPNDRAQLEAVLESKLRP